MNSSKTRVVTSSIVGKICSVIGYVYAVYTVFGLIGCIAMQGSGSADFPIESILVTLPIAIGISAFFIYKGISIKNRIKRFKNYIHIISFENIRSMQNIAARTNKPVNFVLKDLQKMIRKKYFQNAFIDMRTGEIIINIANSNIQQQKQNAMPFKMNNVNNVNSKEKVECPGCGALNTKVKGSAASCEYCGSSI